MTLAIVDAVLLTGGAAVVVGVGRLLFDRIDETRAALSGRIDTLTAPEPVRARPELSFEERNNLQAAWSTAHCPTCGCIHFGVCPRISKVTSEFKANRAVTVTTEYWPDGRWQLPAYHLTVDDVFGDAAPPAPNPTREGTTNAADTT